MSGGDFDRFPTHIHTRYQTEMYKRTHLPPRPGDHPQFQPPTTPLTPLMQPDASPPLLSETDSDTDTGPGRWRRLVTQYGRDAVGVVGLGVYACAVANTPAEERLSKAGI